MFRLVEENDDFILVDKAPGISFHGEMGEAGDAGEPGLLATVKSALQMPELYPVHRLDKMTSGLVLFAKTVEANRALSMLFQARQVEKYYLALSDKTPRKKQGLIKGDMARSRRGTWKLLPTRDNPAITQFFSKGLGEGRRLFLLKPHTGKTHQLRVAMKSIGASIIGDPLYGAMDNAQVFDRGYLHAYCLAFSLNGKDYRFLCKPTQGEYFNVDSIHKLLSGTRAEWAKPWELAWPGIEYRRHP